MDPNTIAPVTNDVTDAWLTNRMEIEAEWHSALYGEASDLVPAKLQISQPPIRRAA
jgi:hypothetical protein